MLIRIVRMSFAPENVDAFRELFEEVQPKIIQMEGCKHVEMCVDATDKNVCYTFSKWDNEDALNVYRNSDFFEATWKKTKALFNDKPLAYSLLQD